MTAMHSLLVVYLVFIVTGGSAVASVVPTTGFACWIQQPVGLSLVWSISHDNANTVEIPHAVFDNHLSLPSLQGQQPSVFPASELSYLVSFTVPATVTWDVLIWTLAGIPTRITHATIVDSTLECRVKHADDCSLTIAGFCENTVFCADPMHCSSDTHHCVAGSESRCPSTSPHCMETEQRCVECVEDIECASDVFCGDHHRCNELTRTCESTGPWCEGTCVEDTRECIPYECNYHADCGEGTFCAGAPRCNFRTHTCQPSAPETHPCYHSGQHCNEKTKSCIECSTHEECDDGIRCNGEERCNTSTGKCVLLIDYPPCDDGYQCNEETGECQECVHDLDCYPSDAMQNGYLDAEWCAGTFECTVGACVHHPRCADNAIKSRCNERTRVCHGCLHDRECDNGKICDGVEHCDVSTGMCVSGSPLCGSRVLAIGESGEIEHCDEIRKICIARFICTIDTDCVNPDALFCDTPQVCDPDTKECMAGPTPRCPSNRQCIESSRSCGLEQEAILFAIIFPTVFILAIILFFYVARSVSP